MTKNKSETILKLGGFSEPMSGSDNRGRTITVALGWGTNESYSMAESGNDKTPAEFMGSPINEKLVIRYLMIYAAHNIHKMSAQNSALSAIDEITSTFVDDVEVLTDNNVMPEAIANALVLYFNNNENIANDNLDDETYDKLKRIVRAVIDMAVKTDQADTRTHENLLAVAYALHPLMSRDYRTINIGFELREYISYFAKYKKYKRGQLANKMINDWEEAGYLEKSTKRYSISKSPKK